MNKYHESIYRKTFGSHVTLMRYGLTGICQVRFDKIGDFYFDFIRYHLIHSRISRMDAIVLFDAWTKCKGLNISDLWCIEQVSRSKQWINCPSYEPNNWLNIKFPHLSLLEKLQWVKLLAASINRADRR